MYRTKICVACCLGAMLLMQAGAVLADTTSWNAVADLGSNNPSNTVWSYGWASGSDSGLDGTYSDKNDERPDAIGGPGRLMSWHPSDMGDPCVVKNFTSSVIYVSEWADGGIDFQPDKLFLYSGYGSRAGQASVVKFTAPSTGNYAISASLSMVEYWGTGGVAKNMTTLGSGTSLASAGMATGDSLPYSDTVALAMGDTISFYNASGYPNSWNSGGMNLSATITLVPEPSCMVLVASGLLGLLAYAWRKRK
jgi:hypothetical protein